LGNKQTLKNSYRIEEEENINITTFLQEEREKFCNNSRHRLIGITKEEDEIDEIGKKVIRIGTHNVRGITDKTKQQNLVEEILEQGIGILGLCETKLTETNAQWAFNNQKDYKHFHSTNKDTPFGAGVSLLIRRDLEKKIASVEKEEGYIIAANLLMKRKKICIIQVYIPSDKPRCKMVQNKITSLIKNKHGQGFHTIVMGDFNAAYNPSEDRKSTSKASFRSSWRPEIPLFNFLDEWDFIDIQATWEGKEKTPTRRNLTSSSRIDYIWISHSLTSYPLLRFDNQNMEDVTGSDHTMLLMTLHDKNLFTRGRTTQPPMTK
jgi:exonuclease III